MYKEIILAKQAGYEPELICFEFDNWSKEINDQLKKQLGNIKITSIQGGRTPFLTWLWSVITEMIYRTAGRLFSLSGSGLSQAYSRRGNLLIKSLKKASKPDWVIGHNLGALWPAVLAAKKFNCKVGFDMEDYHPGEGRYKYINQLSKKLIHVVLPSVNYISFASPLIQQAVQKDMDATFLNCFTVMNYFPASEFTTPVSMNAGVVKMVWFSQNINSDRGLELILPSLKKYLGKLELHLFGNLDDKFYQQQLKAIPNITVHSPLPQKELHQKLTDFDIGLAVEIAKDKNNELAVSNKVLAYLQAGLFVLFTDTPAQQDLLSRFPGHGYCFNYKFNNSDAAVENIINEINTIRNKKLWRYQNFSNQNWETASVKLLNTWKN